MADPRNSRWSSYTHTVGGRTFAVWEVTEWDGALMHVRRELLDTKTGELVKEWRPIPGSGLPAYDFNEMEQWLQQKYSIYTPPAIGFVDGRGFRLERMDFDSSNNPPVERWVKENYQAYTLDIEKRCAGQVLESRRETMARLNTHTSSGAYIQGAMSWNNNNNITMDTLYADFKTAPYITRSDHMHGAPIVPDEAEYIPTALYGGGCDACTARIERGSPIWWLRRENRSRIWCGAHKKHDPAATAGGQDSQKDDDMAQRQDFTFPYSGAEIAASLERKAAKLDAQQIQTPKIDMATLRVLYPSYSAEDLADVVKTKQGEVDRKNEKLAKDAAAIRKEAIPYAKAGKMAFEIDLEDIEFFGLNDDDAPIRAPRKRAAKPSQPVEAA